jgi:hypothetical protein
MRQISITSTTSLDGSELARALVRHGLALCGREHVDLVDVSVVTADGTSQRMRFAASDTAEPIGEMSFDLSEDIVESRTVDMRANHSQKIRPYTLADLNGQSWSSFVRPEEFTGFDL